MFMKYNDGIGSRYGEITTSNAKKAIIDMVHRKDKSLVKQMDFYKTMRKPSLTLPQFENIISNLYDLNLVLPQMNIYMPLKHREQIPAEVISWYKDKIFSCYR